MFGADNGADIIETCTPDANLTIPHDQCLTIIIVHLAIINLSISLYQIRSCPMLLDLCSSLTFTSFIVDDQCTIWIHLADYSVFISMPCSILAYINIK